ncbi:hypothetical protein BDZ89DRAFT_1055423, partial [Hymenopellis radicata]
MTGINPPRGDTVHVRKPTLRPRKTRVTNQGWQQLAMEVRRAVNKIAAGKNMQKLLSWREKNKRAAAAAARATQASTSSTPADNEPEISPLSSLESLLSTVQTHGNPSEEPTRSTPSGRDFVAAIADFSPDTLKTVANIFSGISGTKRATPDTAPESPSAAAARRRKLNSTAREEAREPGALYLPKDIHPEIMRLADAKAYVPLHLFTTAARRVLFHSGNLPMTDDKKGSLLDTSAAVFGTPEEQLSEAEWRDAVPFYSEFIAQTGNYDWAERWNEHFGFFVTTCDMSEDNWVPYRNTELALRRSYRINPFTFTRELYAEEIRTQKEKIREEKEKIRDEKDKALQKKWEEMSKKS